MHNSPIPCENRNRPKARKCSDEQGETQKAASGRRASNEARHAARFRRLPPYPGLKLFAKGISCTERWTGNEYKAMARVLLPVVQDLLSAEMVKLLQAYLDIIQLTHYTSHTEQTVEYLRRAVDEYT